MKTWVYLFSLLLTLCFVFSTSISYAQAPRLQGLRGEYYEWDPALGGVPDRADVFKPENLKVVRLDPTVNFGWGTGQPDPDVRADQFAVRWTGQVVAPTTDDYTFFAAADDGVQLWVSDKPIDPENPGDPIIDPGAWKLQGETEYKALEPIKLEAGKAYYIMMEMYENGGGAAARLRWKPTQGVKQIIPASQLIPAVEDPNDTTPPAPVSDLAVLSTSPTIVELSWTSPGGDAMRYDVRYSVFPITEENWANARQASGEPKPSSAGTKETFKLGGLDPIQSYYFAVKTIDKNFNVSVLSNLVTGTTPGGEIGDGLKGEYYIWSPRLGGVPDRTDVFTPDNLKLTRIDPTVNFGWGGGTPAPGVRGDNFAVRWSGLVKSPVSEEVTFFAAADDGVRLWVSEKPIDPDIDNPIVDAWRLQAETEYAADPIKLEAGKKYYILMEMYENAGDASARLRWASASIPKQIISQAFLFSSEQVPKFGRLSGTVVDAEKKPISRASVTVKSGEQTYSLRTDTAGYYTLLIPVGKAEITVTFGDLTAQATVEIKADQITVQDFTLVPPAPAPGPAPTQVCGDANGDGKVNLADAILALQFAVGSKKPTEAQIPGLDLNGDGKIQLGEVIRVLRKAVNPQIVLEGPNCVKG